MSQKPTCTAKSPAPPSKKLNRYSGAEYDGWNFSYEHPDATRRCVDDDHDDYEYRCPHCRMTFVAEGPDY